MSEDKESILDRLSDSIPDTGGNLPEQAIRPFINVEQIRIEIPDKHRIEAMDRGSVSVSHIETSVDDGQRKKYNEQFSGVVRYSHKLKKLIITLQRREDMKRKNEMDIRWVM